MRSARGVRELRPNPSNTASLVSPSQSLSSRSSTRTKKAPPDESMAFQWWLPPPSGTYDMGPHVDAPTIGQRSGHGIVVEVVWSRPHLGQAMTEHEGALAIGQDPWFEYLRWVQRRSWTPRPLPIRRVAGLAVWYRTAPIEVRRVSPIAGGEGREAMSG